MNGPCRCIIFILLFYGTLLPWPCNAFARTVTISDSLVNSRQDDLVLFLRVEGAFNRKLDKAVQSGVPATFVFIVSLSEDKGVFRSRTILELNATHTLKYNAMKNNYTVQRSWEDQPLITDEYDEAKKWMTEIENMRLIPLSHLQKGERYVLRSKVMFEKATLPVLNYIFFFMSLWDFESDWHYYRFIY